MSFLELNKAKIPIFKNTYFIDLAPILFQCVQIIHTTGSRGALCLHINLFLSKILLLFI